MIWLFCLTTVLLLNGNNAQPVPDPTTEALLVVSENVNTEVAALPKPPELRSMQVTSNIRNRYARTVVSSKYANPDEKSQETTFSIVLPDTAFISGFIMEIDGKKYEAYVREKEQAKKEYDEAVSQGIGAAHVAVSARDTNKFTVSVNVEPHSKVIFNLTYEELLVRKHDKYEMIVNLQPGKFIDDLGINVNINESRPIINIETPALRSGNEIIDKVTKNEFATIDKDADGVVHVKFNPTIQQQKQMAKILNNTDDNKGISGQFVVQYDVERDPQGGEVLVNDGYFVHFFAPSDLKPIPKHVVFVLDVSGSMWGRKIEQLKEAMQIILGELNPDDYFNLVKFHSSVHVLDKDNKWAWIENPQESELPQATPVTPDNIQKTKDVVKEMQDEGATNIYDALLVGLRLASRGLSDFKETENKHKPQPIVVFLTDGQANVGISDPKQMVEMVEKRNDKQNKAAVFTLAFGDDANKEFLKELALKNSGFLRNIYEASDASLQLQDFYKQISSPLLTDVNFKYENEVKDVTKHKFDILFKGTEFIVAGRIDNPTDKFVDVEAQTLNGIRRFPPIIIPIIPKPEVKEEYGSLERLWAYLTIKQLLDKKYEKTENSTDADNPEKQALKLALKYSFVTPLTSLVVVKPNQTDSSIPVKENTNSQVSVSNNRVAFFGGQTLIAGAPGIPQSLGAGPLYGPPALSSPHYSTTFRLPETSFDSIPSFPTLPTLPPFIPVYPTVDPNLPEWLKSLITPSGSLTIDSKIYDIGNNGTVVENKTCQVESLNISGNCTLLSACPKLYPTLDKLETLKTYFCSLESDKFAGICCPVSEDNQN